jgi:hypothetical protein
MSQVQMIQTESASTKKAGAAHWRLLLLRDELLAAARCPVGDSHVAYSSTSF